MQNDLVVDTASGKVRGRLEGGVARFLGLPFAAPPTGERRFRAPAPVAPWSGARDATAPGPACPQRLSGGSAWIYEDDGGPDEDCLYLNVWAPGRDGARPVLVWFHGGAFRTGHGALPCFDGTRLAQDGDLVVVTCNYRLGALGWLAHPDLRDPDTGHWANWGLQDQVAALRWVRANIAAFGGDPGNVTLVGESAGAMSLAHLARNPANRGLFHKLLAESPARRVGDAGSPELAAAYAEAVAAELGVTVRDLRGVPTWALYEAEQAVSRRPAWPPRLAGATPVRDDDLVPAAGRPPADLPLLAGSNRDEARFWHTLAAPDGAPLPGAPLPAGDADLTPAVADYLAATYPDATALDPAALADAYRSAAPAASAAERFLDVRTDGTFRAPVAAWAADHAARGGAAYVYEFAHPSPLPGVGCPHTLEIPFVFGTFGQPFLAPKAGAGPAEEALSAAVRAIWAAFAHTGDPSTAAHGAWPRYDAARRAVGVVGGPEGILQVVEAPREATRAAWEPAFRA
ncbi:MAG TPA: carboxylesterase family protein [Thermomicrobiales bacterium]|nr:carboxylesterase family protein [Thermomicrobiales bacterium]